MANSDDLQLSKITITDKDGNVIETLDNKTGQVYKNTPAWRKEDGTWTTDPSEVAKYSISETGAIKLRAPKIIYELPEFQKIFDEDVLKSYSAAYRTNPAYRVPYTKLNDDGTTSETQLTIPEFVDELNVALKNFTENYKVAEANRDILNSKYGEKAENLSLTQINMYQNSNAKSKRVYIPDFLFNYENSFNVLKDKRDEDGSVDAEDLKKVYQLGVTSQEELAGVLATIEGHLKASEWGEDEITFDDGSTMKNANSATEAAKALAFKNYILSVDPEADWYESLGAGAATLGLNAAEGFTRVFMNTATMAEGIVTFGQSHIIENATEEMDKAMSNWNEERTLIQDSTATLATLGQIGGMIGGTIAEAWLLKKAGAKVSNAYMGKLESAAKASAGSKAVAKALKNSKTTADQITNLVSLIDNVENISLGAKFVISTAPIVSKVAWATNVAKTFLHAEGGLNTTLNWTTSFLLDTVHDAIVYDAVTLRHVLEGDSEQSVKDYWLGQLLDNSKWWIGIGAAKTSVKLWGKSKFGQAVNAKTTQKLQGLIAKAGDVKKKIKDNIYGGDVIRHIKEEINNLPNGVKKDRLNTKLELLKADEVLRGERRALAALDLEWDGLKLSEESASEYRRILTNIKTWESAIDARAAGVTQKVQEMVSKVKDPSTGKVVYINPKLGAFNTAAGDLYGRLLGFTQDYHLTKATGSDVSQDIIDYLSGNAEKLRKSVIAGGKGPDVSKAKADVRQITKNLEVIKDRLPEEVVKYLDNPATLQTYFDFYKELRTYQDLKINAIDRERLARYRGDGSTDQYMPIVKETESTGYYTRKDGSIARKIDEEFKEFTYGVKEGQHYVDPEITRQRALWETAEAEISTKLNEAYRGFESASYTELASGTDTKLAKEAKVGAKGIDDAVRTSAPAVTDNFKQTVDITKPRKNAKKVLKNRRYNQEVRTEVLSAFSLDDTTQVLHEQGVLKGGAKKLSSLVSADNYDNWYNNQTKPVKNYLKSEYSKLNADPNVNNYELFKKCVQNGKSDFEAGLQRAYLIGDDTFAKSPILNEALRNLVAGKEAFADGFFVTMMKGELRNVEGIDVDKFVKSLDKALDEGFDNYVASLLANPDVKKALNAVSDSAENGSELLAKYTALKHLNRSGRSALNDTINRNLDAMFNGKDISKGDFKKIQQEARAMAVDKLKAEINDTRSALKTINPDLADKEDYFKQVKELNKEMTGLKEQALDASSDIIFYRDELGREVYAQVDPNFASLYKMRKTMTRESASAFAKVNAAMSKLFRYGTTTLNLTSFSNQLFRDTGNALFVGGAWQTIKVNADNLVDVFGEDIVEHIKKFEPEYEFKQLQDYAKEYDMSLKEAAVSRELARGAALSPATTETTLYKRLSMKSGLSSETLVGRMNTKMRNVIDKFASVDELTNGKREVYLRNRVFASNLNQALSEGYNFGQARAYANFAMENATTNFTRQIYHMQAIADSTPYFRAAINGTKSFWRMWSLDPVGISGRIMGGLILPTIFLTGASLGDPENKEVYKNIPEYQKEDSLIFVVDKQIISVPIPQEIAKVVAPFRQFVEYLNGANESDFWELMMNDALGLSPVDLQGFSTIDMDKMSHDPTIGDRLSRGFSRIFSQMAPVPVKSTYMMVTGTDPYTGKNLYDPSYTYYNYETGEPETMDEYQNDAAKLIADLWGKESNAAVLSKVLDGILGTTGSNFLGQVVSLFTEGAEDAVRQFANDVMDQATKPYYVPYYNQADAVWKRAINALTAKKDEITSSKEFKTIYSQLSQVTDETKRKQLVASGQNLIANFQQEVITTIERLTSEYNGTFDRSKLAAVLALLNFNSDPVYQSGTRYSSNVASDAHWEGRDAAVSTLNAMGVTGVSDMSIFGYLTTDENGNSVMKYASPIAIMDMKNAWMGSSDIDTANIEAKLKADGLTKSKKWDGYYTAKAKGKAALRQYKAAWNAEIVKSLASYIAERGVDSVLANSSTKQLLNDYMLLDNSSQLKAYLKKIFENA